MRRLFFTPDSRYSIRAVLNSKVSYCSPPLIETQLNLRRGGTCRRATFSFLFCDITLCSFSHKYLVFFLLLFSTSLQVSHPSSLWVNNGVQIRNFLPRRLHVIVATVHVLPIMSGFAALLKLSQSQTAQSELEVQAQIASHQLHLEKKRREQEAKERKEREVEAKLRAKRFEEQRKEEERKQKRAEEERARQRELAKREEEMRHVLKYGPRKSSASGSSKGRGGDNGGGSGGGPALTREELRKRQNEASDFSVLTREEKRERKLAAELRKNSSSSRRTNGGSHRTASLPNGHTVRRLPGGAVDYTTVSRLADPDASPPLPSGDLAGKSARERLAAMPSTLLKLNTIKRDVRTIDEILTDRAKAKHATVLAGDEAKEFSDWFGKNKKKEKSASQLSTPQQLASVASSPALSATPSGSPAPSVNPFAGATSVKAKTATLATPPKSSSPFLKSINPKPSTILRPSNATSALPSSKKRARSPDDDTSLPSAKRRLSASSRPAAASSRPVASSRPSAPSSRPSTLSNGVDISTEIWSIFGKDKKSYVARDVLSDDEDMEADAQSVLKEEARRYVPILLCKPCDPFFLRFRFSAPVSPIRKMRMLSPRKDGVKRRRGGGRRSGTAGKSPRLPVRISRSS